MLKFDDRFARQDRCETPSEFPLTSLLKHSSHPFGSERTGSRIAATRIKLARGRRCADDESPDHTYCFRFATGVCGPIDFPARITSWSVSQDGSVGVPGARRPTLGARRCAEPDELSCAAAAAPERRPPKPYRRERTARSPRPPTSANHARAYNSTRFDATECAATEVTGEQ